MKKLFTSLGFIFLACLSVYSSAQSTTFSDYTIQHQVFPSTALPASMAQAYGIERQDNLAVMIVAVGDSKALYAGTFPTGIKGSRKDLLGRKNALKFKKIADSDNSFYQVAQFRYSPQETLVFELEIQVLDPDGKIIKPLQTKFQKLLW